MEYRTVGRDSEISALAEAVDSAARGRGGIVLVSGEAGIGKSQLAAEAVRTASESGFAVLQGRADPLLSGLAYAAVVEAFRPYLNALTDTESARLVTEIPDIGRLFIDPRFTATPAGDRVTGDQSLERTRMYEAALRLVERIAARSPLLLFVDDLHWADHGTVELVHYLGRGAPGHRVLVLACHRHGEVAGPLDTLVTSVRRSRHGREIPLAPLSDAAVADLVGHLLARTPEPELVHDVTTRAQGVPLFVTALVREEGTHRSGTLPMIIRDAVLDRLHRLDADERRLLEIVAVTGHEGTPAILHAVWGGQEEAVDAVLCRLVRARLVTEQQHGAVLVHRVAHPLYAEVAYAELTVAERRALHGAVAAAIDEVDPTNVLALAPHCAASGDLVASARAIEILAVAGRRALAVHDANEAVTYLGAALRRARAEKEPGLVPALLMDLARAYQGQGRLDDAAASWREAFAVADQRGDADQRRALLRYQALLEVERGNVSAAVDHARSGRLEPPGKYSLALMVEWAVALGQGDVAELKVISGRMASLPAVDDTPGALSLAHFGSGMLAAIDNDFATAHAEIRRALDTARSCGDDAVRLACAPSLAFPGLCALRGDLGPAIEFAQSVSASQMRFVLPGAGCYVHYTLAIARYLAGDVAGAITEADSGIAEARRTGLDHLISRGAACRAFLLAEQGEADLARAVLAEVERGRDQTQPDLVGALDETRTMIELARTAIDLHVGQPTSVPTVAEAFPFGDALLSGLHYTLSGLAAIAAGDETTADRVGMVLRRTGRTAPFFDALADRHEGLLAAARGDRPDARDLLDSAATRLGTMGAGLFAAQARLEWAELTPRTEVGDAITHCLSVFSLAGSTRWTNRARRLARTTGIRIAAQRAAQKPGGKTLSRRETEVVDLVAQGLSNAEIASRLFLSERTVETHLHNSYKRLGISTRVALAQWATQHYPGDRSPGDPPAVPGQQRGPR